MSEKGPSDKGKVFEGTCQCHAVHFRIEAPTLWCAHCHCSMCRRAHGAAFVTWIGVAEERFSVTAGRRALRWYASSTQAERGFCSECGSTMFFRSERWPDQVHVARASVEGQIDREPQAHVYYDSHAPWIENAEALPKKPRA